MGDSYDKPFFDKRSAGADSSARALIPLVLDLVGPSSVVDVGCARGEWLSVFRELGVGDFLGVDGTHVDLDSLVIPKDRFVQHDLSTGTVPVERTFDLAMSLEVAEHLPPESADRFVASLAGLAPIVLFSAAIPFQGGTMHVNEQWPTYWVERFAKHDFQAIDAIRRRCWTNQEIATWYRQNTLVYVRSDVLEHNAKLQAEHARTEPTRLNVILPEVYLREADPPTRKLWRRLRRRLLGKEKGPAGR